MFKIGDKIRSTLDNRSHAYIIVEIEDNYKLQSTEHSKFEFNVNDEQIKYWIKIEENV